MHARGSTNKAKGKVEQAVGKLTGDRRLEAKGKAKQIQGSAQQGLGDIENAFQRTAD